MTLPADSTPPGEYYCPACERTFQLGGGCPIDGTRLVKLKIAIDPFLGRELDGKYTIIEKLGQGGMGAVYRCAQHSVGREVAIKVVSPHLVSDSDVIKRFLREAKLASKLSHPNAVAVFDFNQTDDGVFYLVMELVTGRTLDQVFKEEGVFRPERLVRIGTQVCDALEGAHALQIIHRDLKPANIMLLAQGRDLIKVLDFGLAKSVAPDQAVTTMTNAGALLGTPAFIPPELALGQACDGRADLYSLGCILYLLGSGKLPFLSESPHEMIALHATETAPPMANAPPAIASVVARLLEKDPKRRFQNAAETREALEGAFTGRFTPLPQASQPAPRLTNDNVAAGAVTHPSLVRLRRGWRLPLALAGVVIAGAAIALVALNNTGSGPQDAADTTAPTVPQPATPTATDPPRPVAPVQQPAAVPADAAVAIPTSPLPSPPTATVTPQHSNPRPHATTTHGGGRPHPPPVDTKPKTEGKGSGQGGDPPPTPF